MDEIKSFSQPLDSSLKDGYPVHWAQAKMYAFMYSKDHELAEMTVQLTYVHVESEAKKYFKKNFTFSELESFATEMIEGYAPMRRSNKTIAATEMKVSKPYNSPLKHTGQGSENWQEPFIRQS